MFSESFDAHEYDPACRGCGRTDSIIRIRPVYEREYIILDADEDQITATSEDSDMDSYDGWIFRCDACDVNSEDLEDILAPAKFEDCETCDGSGMVEVDAGDAYDHCHVCNGTGEIKVVKSL